MTRFCPGHRGGLQKTGSEVLFPCSGVQNNLGGNSSVFVTQKLYSDTKEGLVSIPVSAPERILQLPCQVREHILLAPDSSLSHANTHTLFSSTSLFYIISHCVIPIHLYLGSQKATSWDALKCLILPSEKKSRDNTGRSEIFLGGRCRQNPGPGEVLSSAGTRTCFEA